MAYSIGLNNRDLPLIINIQKFFKGVGKVSFYAKNNSVIYTVASIKDINAIIIPPRFAHLRWLMLTT